MTSESLCFCAVLLDAAVDHEKFASRFARSFFSALPFSVVIDSESIAFWTLRRLHDLRVNRRRVGDDGGDRGVAIALEWSDRDLRLRRGERRPHRGDEDDQPPHDPRIHARSCRSRHCNL